MMLRYAGSFVSGIAKQLIEKSKAMNFILTLTSARAAIALPVMLLMTIAFSACKKDRHQPDTIEDKKLTINFPAGTIPVSSVDSANIVFTKQGSSIQTFKRLDKSATTLSVIIDDLSAGNWTAVVTIYTSKVDDQSSRMFTRSVAFSLPLASGLALAGPTGDIKGVWKPHIVMASDNNDVVVVVAADNEDPYFDIRVKDSRWNYFYMERYAHNRTGTGNEQMAADQWECFNSCYTVDKLIIDKTSFIPFTNTVKTRPWNNGEIFVVVADINTNEERTFFYLYNK
jgi:hypothetical protein